MNTFEQPNLEYDHIIAVNVDPQNDFCPGGRLAVAEGDRVIDPLNRVNAWVRSQNGQVIVSRDWHPRNTRQHFRTFPAHCVQYTAGAAFHDDLILEPSDLVASKGMNPDADDFSALVATFDDGQGATTVADYLLQTALRIETGFDYQPEMWLPYERVYQQRVAIAIGGLATEYCDKATVLGALEISRHISQITQAKLGEKALAQLDVYVLEDAVRAVDATAGVTALAEMRNAGARFITSDDLVSGKVLTMAGRQ